MAVAVGTTSTLALANRTNSVVTAPASIVNGDLLLAFVSAGDSGDQVAPTVTAPAGFTTATGSPASIAWTGDTNYGIALNVFWKIAASESGSYTFTHAAADSEVLMYRIVGHSVTTPLNPNFTSNVFQTSVAGVGKTATALGLTTATANSLVIYGVLLWDGGPGTQPSGTTPTFTERLDSGAFYFADGVLATAGATGDKVNATAFTAQGGTSPWRALLVAVQAAPWSFVGISATVEAVATPLTLTEPAGVANGDLLVATISSRSTATTAPTAAGWTAVNSQNNNNTLTTTSALGSGAMLYQIRSGTPTLAFTLPTGISVAQGCITAYRGSAQTTPLDVSTAVTTAINTLAVSVTGLTTTQDNDLIVAMAAGGQEATWTSFTNVGFEAGWSTTDKSANITPSGTANKIATTTSATAAGVRSTLSRMNGSAGKFYAEFLVGATVWTRYGISPIADAVTITTNTFHVNLLGDINKGSTTVGSVGSAPVNGDVICVAWDTGAEKVWFRLNAGLWNNDASANPATGANSVDVSSAPSTAHALWANVATSGAVATIRTESADFTQAVPSGFSGWASGMGPFTASGVVDTTSPLSTGAWIKRAETVTTSGADTSLGVFDAVRTGTGATGNLTVTASLGAGHVVIAGAFKLAAAATSAPSLVPVDTAAFVPFLVR